MDIKNEEEQYTIKYQNSAGDIRYQPFVESLELGLNVIYVDGHTVQMWRTETRGAANNNREPYLFKSRKRAARVAKRYEKSQNVDRYVKVEVDG